ncbi:SGNH/GDSL hydrolase family protein [Bacteroidota bacterium]
MPTKLVKLLKAGLRFLGLAVLFVVTLEICTRIDDMLTWEAPFWGRYDNSLLYVSDRFGIHGRPNGQFEKWKLNQFGFRGPEISKAKPPGVYRIAVMGASEPFGQAESPGMEFPAQLQTILDRSRRGRYQVLNTAVPGMSLPRINEFLGDYVRQFEPDLLVVYPVAADHLDFRCPEPRKALPVPRPKKNRPSLRLLRRLRVVVKRILPTEIASSLRAYQTRRSLRQYGVQEQWRSPPPERLAAYREHLTSVVDQARSCGIDVLLATHAHRFGETLSAADHNWLIAWRKFYPLAGGDCLIQMETEANTIIRRTAKDRGTRLADVADTISPGNENFSDFVHFTDLGARIVAEAIAAKVLEIDGGSSRHASRAGCTHTLGQRMDDSCITAGS